MQLSPDGQWVWDGAQWRPAYSPDRAWRWDGTRWVPAVQRWRYEPTVWTRRLQLVLIALMVLGLVMGALLLPGMLSSVFQQSIDNAIAQQPPDANVDPAQLRSFLTSIVYWTLGITGIFAIALLAIVVVGIIRLWRWVYWYLAVSQLLAVLSLPSNLFYALGAGPIRMPGWWLAYVIPAALIEGALGAWMIVLYRRYGTWARRRVPA